MIDASVVDLPEPVGPVTRIKPCGSATRRSKIGGRSSSAKLGMSNGITRSDRDGAALVEGVDPKARDPWFRRTRSRAPCRCGSARASRRRAASRGSPGVASGVSAGRLVATSSPSIRSSGGDPAVSSRSLPLRIESSRRQSSRRTRSLSGIAQCRTREPPRPQSTRHYAPRPDADALRSRLETSARPLRRARARRANRRRPRRRGRGGREIGYPVVAKLCGAGIAHKTERGLVRLGLRDAASVRAAATDLLALAQPDDGAVEVLVAPMVRGNRELIAGLVADPAVRSVRDARRRRRARRGAWATSCSGSRRSPTATRRT